MTEAEWLAATDPTPMLDWLTERTPAPSERKMRLLLAGCVRRRWDQFPFEDMRNPTLTAERYADGAATPEELHEVHSRYFERATYGRIRQGDTQAFFFHLLAYAPSVSGRLIARPQRSTTWPGVSTLAGDSLPDFLRCVFGNPFRPITADPSWLTPTVVSLAEGIYADRAFDRLPILADALQDAGCENTDILDHCRGEGVHVRGCWVVDLLLGKS
jgi:hypothetical protein